MTNLRVLILEDDELSVKHLQFMLNQFGIHQIKSCNIHDFKFMVSIEHYHIIILDGFLEGGVSGLDMIQHIDDTIKNTFIWVISGIIGENHIPRNLLPRIHTFFKKPINGEKLERALKKVNDEVTKDLSLEGILDSFLTPSFSSESLRSLIQTSPAVHGHELAILICLLADSRWTGQVNLKISKKYDVRLLFLNGDMVSIQTPDQKSFFGILAKAHGFVTESVIRKLISKGGDEPIGHKLVHSGYLSPHSVYFILEEQSKIRLSQLMGFQQNYKIKLVSKSVQKHSDGVVISFQQKPSFLLEILWSKIELEWLKDFFSDKNNYVLKFNHPKVNEMNKRWQNNFEQIMKQVDNQKTVSEIRKEVSLDPHEFLFSLYYLLVSKCLFYQKNKEDEKLKSDLEARIKQFKKQMKKSHYFDLLGLQKKASSSEVKNRLTHVIKVFHPDQYLDPKIKKTCNEILFHLNEMKDILLNKEKRIKYTKTLEKKQGENFVHLFSEYKKGKEEISRSQKYTEGLRIIEPIKDESSLPEDVRLYYTWALMKTHVIQDINMKTVFKILDRMSVEMKCTALYFFVRALCYLKQDEKSVAYDYLKKCLAIDENFFPARLEWVQLKKDKSIFKKLFFNAS